MKQSDQVMKRGVFSRLIGTTAMIVVAACGTDSGQGQLNTSVHAKQAPLRAAYIAAIQHDAPESYWARESAGGVVMDNIAQRFVAKVENGALSVTPNDHPWRFALRGTAVGCAGDMEPMTEAAAEVASHGVQLQRPDMTEWYLNGPLGVEQGFVMGKAPACSGHKTITMAIEGDLSAVLDDTDGDGRADAVKFVDHDARVALRYADLFVTDAQGHSVPAWLSVKSGEIAIVVDDASAVYPLTIDPLLWVEQAKLTANFGDSPDSFGVAVAVDGDTAFVGAHRTSDGGAAYVFTRSGGVWTQQQKFIGDAHGYFGQRVVLDGDTAVVSAPEEQIGPNNRQGAVYVYTRNGSVWSKQQKLTSSDGWQQDVFGGSTALSGDTIFAGASGHLVGTNLGQGAVYVFTRNGGVWTQQQEITASDGDYNDGFGGDIELLGNTAIIGAASDTIGANIDQGSAYVFTFNAGVWTENQKFTASDGKGGLHFGAIMALYGDTLFLGTPYDDIGANQYQGSVYVFTRAGGLWTEQQKLIASDGVQHDMFGRAIAVYKDRALVGAPNVGTAPNHYVGAVYALMRDGNGVWTEQQKFMASDGATNDVFGYAVALSNNTAFIGAFGKDIGQNVDQGTVYTFEFVGQANGTTCVGANQCASGVCVDSVCCDTACGQGDANDCQACSVATGAAVDGTCAMIVAGTVCRNATSTCDVEETCDGAMGTCPADVKLAMGTICRASTGACDIAETCDGIADTCSADAKIAAGIECRPRVGVCDIAESCDGASDVCPADAKAATGTACRASAGACDVTESCDGASDVCPADAKVAAGTACRASVEACDVAEICDGITNVCPMDSKVAAGTECRASTGACDVAESCNGSADACPADSSAPDGTSCPSGICMSGTCMGTGGAGSSTGSSSSSGTGGAGGGGGAVEVGGGSPVIKNDPGPIEFGGWNCRISTVNPASKTRSGLFLFGLALVAVRRRRTR